MSTARDRLRAGLRRVGITRGRVAKVRMFAERHTLATVHRSAPSIAGRILCYHGVDQPAWGPNNVSARRFRAQLEAALTAGFRFVPAQRIADGEGGPKDLAVTFDDGLRSVLASAAPILDDLHIPSTLFVVARWADRPAAWEREHMLGWDEIATLAQRGVTIGSHSLTHPDLAQLDEAATRHELVASADEIEAHLGVRPTEFAIPYGQSANANDWVEPAARAAGYRYVYAQAERTRPRGTVARTFVSSFDNARLFDALLDGAFDRWEEWA